MSRKRGSDEYGDNSNQKRHYKGDQFSPITAGLPAKPDFSQVLSKPLQNQQTPPGQNNNTGSIELFPGMVVNLPQENKQENTDHVSNRQPSSDALKLFSSIIGTLHANKQQQQQHQPHQQHQQQQQPFFSQGYDQLQNSQTYNQPYNPQYNQPYNQPYHQTYNPYSNQQYNNSGVFNPAYNQAFESTTNQGYHQVPQCNYNPVYHQLQSNYNGYQQNTLPQQPYNPAQQNNAFLTLFNNILQNQNQNQNQNATVANDENIQSTNNPTSNFPIPEKPKAGNNTKKTKQKQNNKKEILAKTDIKEDDGKDSDDDNFTDDEADWNKEVSIQGTNIVFENEEDIQKWIEERKKNWPTKKRVEEKNDEIEKSKKIIENLSNNSNNTKTKSGSSNIRICKFWMKNGKCKSGKNCKFSHDATEIAKAKDSIKPNNKPKNNAFTNKPLPNHKVKLIHGIPIQIPQRFTPLTNNGKSLHNLLVEGDQLKQENMELIELFEKMVRYKIINQNWDTLKRKLKLDDESLNSM